MFLIWVLHLDDDLDTIIEFDRPGSKFWLSKFVLKFERTSVSYSSDLGLWRILDVPAWGLAS